MRLVERHVVKDGSKEYKILDELCYLSKNLYNATLYRVRQTYFKNDRTYLTYPTLQKQFQDENQHDYRSMSIKAAQQTMRMVDQNFRSFFMAIKDYKQNPKKYKGKPKIPKYLDTEKGRFLVTYTSQEVSKLWLKKGYIVLVKLKGIKIKTKVSEIDQVRIVPKVGYIVVEVVYTKPGKNIKPDNGRYASIDLGIDNLATVTSNVDKHVPFVISGKKVKSINHYYNKRRAYLQSGIPKDKPYKTTKRIRRLCRNREFKINDYLHKASRYIVNHLVSENINTLIVGNNKGWKQDTNIGKVNNQNFVSIPYYKFISMLSYKCEMEGISFYTITEEYTSKCSFLDNEEIGKHDQYMGKRIKRGLYQSSNGTLINADVNGSYNILKKCKPNAFANGILGVVVHPYVLCLS